MNPLFKFQSDFSYQERLEESMRVRAKHPSKVPVICELHPKDENHGNGAYALGKSKYLVNEDLTVAQFMQVIRNKIKLGQNVAIFILVNGRMASASQTMNTLYSRYKQTDGFVYIYYSFENVFG
jgi:hypothetical protein